MPSKKTSARAIAAEALNQFDPKFDYASEVLNKLLYKTSESQRATDLVFGTIRNQTAIDTVITRFTDCPVERIQAKALNIIRVGTFELIYSPAAPDYSIVNEAVENAKAIKGEKQVGFVNAALRQVTRHITNRQIQLSQANAQSPMDSLRRTLPQTTTTGCEFDIDILPDAKASPADYLSAAFSLPRWLIKDWLDEYDIEPTRQICFASNRRPSIYIRPNPLKTTAQKLVEKLQQENIDCEVLESTMIRLKSPKDVTELPGFAEGELAIQDTSAARAVRLLNPQHDWKILDLCAAPGTKTTQLAEATGDKARIFATDIDPQRLEKVKENITRLGIKSVTVIEYEKLFENSKFSILNSKPVLSEAEGFDAVLLDVPCSNTGVLAKRIEARYRIMPKAIKALAKIQADLLKIAASKLKPKGKICYSTCSIQKQENQQLVAEFLKENPDFELESEKLVLPSAESRDCDGAYTAIILKKP